MAKDLKEKLRARECLQVCVEREVSADRGRRSGGEEDGAKYKAAQSVYSQLCLLWPGTNDASAGTFEDEGCRFIMVHGEPLKH